MRLALITGGSRGLGRALCVQLEAAGYHVMEFSRGAPHAYSTPLDLGARTTLDTISSTLSIIDAAAPTELLVISNAGVLSPMGPVWRQDPEQILASLSVNLVSAIDFIGAVMRHFRHNSGRKVIVNVSSGAALKGYAGWSLYCAAKAGMENFIRALAAEEQLQEHPFLPVSIDPGVMDTDMQALIRAQSTHDFPEVERFRRRKETGELATPDHVAGCIIRIASRPDLQAGVRYDLPKST
jgi:benzil reductase ((S)-benzoin forming)